MFPNYWNLKVDYKFPKDSNDPTAQENTVPKIIQNNRKRIASNPIAPKPFKLIKIAMSKEPITTNQMSPCTEPSTSYYTSPTIPHIDHYELVHNKKITFFVDNYKYTVTKVQSFDEPQISTSTSNPRLSKTMSAIKSALELMINSALEYESEKLEHSKQQSEKHSDLSQNVINKLKNYYASTTSGTSSSNGVLYAWTETSETRPNEINEDVYIILSDEEDDENQTNVGKMIKTKDQEIDNITICGDKIDDRIVTPIKIFDYKLLNYDRCMNDSIMEFYLNYCYSRKLSVEDKNRTHLFSTFFYTALTKDINSQGKCNSKSRHDRVKNWTKNVNIFEKDFIFIPINKNFHWLMAVICFPNQTGPLNMEDNTEVNTFSDNYDPINFKCTEAGGYAEDIRYYHINFNNKNGVDYVHDTEIWKKRYPKAIKQPCILLFDSRYCCNDGPTIVSTIRDWMVGEHNAKYSGIGRDFSADIMKGHAIKVPQQSNLIDCGLYVIHFFEMFFKSPIVDYRFPITHLENWFRIDDVENGRKRKELQNVMLNVMNEQGRKLPRGVRLPNIKVAKDVSPSTTSQCSLKNHRETYYHNKNYGRFKKRKIVNYGEENDHFEGESNVEIIEVFPYMEDTSSNLTKQSDEYHVENFHLGHEYDDENINKIHYSYDNAVNQNKRTKHDECDESFKEDIDNIEYINVYLNE